MSIALAIPEHYPELSDSQREVIGHLDSPFNRIQTRQFAVERRPRRKFAKNALCGCCAMRKTLLDGRRERMMPTDFDILI